MIKLFVQVLRKQGGGTFTVKDICNWSKLYHDRKGEPIPDAFKRPNKIGRLVPSLCKDLHIIQSNASALGARTYRVEGAVDDQSK